MRLNGSVNLQVVALLDLVQPLPEQFANTLAELRSGADPQRD